MPRPNANSRARLGTRAWICGLVLAAAPAAQALDLPEGWTAEPIQLAPGVTRISLLDLNNRGEVMGQVSMEGSSSGVYLYSGGRMSILPSPAGAEGHRLWVYKMNDVGQAILTGGGQRFLYDNGRFRDFSIPGQPGASLQDVNNRGDVLTDRYVLNANGQTRSFVDPSFSARAMTDSGLVVGTVQAADGTSYTALDDGSSLTRVGPPGMSVGMVNDAGEMAGTFNNTAVFIDRQGQLTEIGRFGGLSSRAVDITDRGEVIGMAEYTPPGLRYPTFHTFVYHDGVANDITDDFRWQDRSSYSASVIDSNDFGQMLLDVWFRMDGWLAQRMYLWDHGKITDLTAMGIGGPGVSFPILNEVGQIASYVWVGNEQWQPFLLTPVPEPQGFALLSAGLLVLVLLRRRAGTARR
ncbi:hypothetical protein [Methylibium rhizosphaerae]|uniref:hypothetical protein n=1 Tax=Methylibium rhizosphaerae TaxID=2570323 RepID=UPI00112C3CFE|nr:hypothetical protein [Methylibium rhizosphaerae]